LACETKAEREAKAAEIQKQIEAKTAEIKRQAEEEIARQEAARKKAILGDEVNISINNCMNDMATVVTKDCINNAKAYINKSRGALTITFDLVAKPKLADYSKSGGLYLRFFVRLFDLNGSYLNNFTTRETFGLYNTNTLPTAVALKNASNTICYSINMRDAQFVQNIEFAFSSQ
jgi:tricorn protease-like protein